MNFGYACINLTLKESNIIVNRGIVRKTFNEKGLALVSDFVKKNLEDLIKLLKWNLDYHIYFYRLSSDMFPWMSEYELPDLPDFENILRLLKEAGDFSKKHQLRITFHPGPFDVLASENPTVVKNTAKDLNQHAEIMSYMGLEASPFYKINIHVGTSLAGRKEKAIENFLNNLRFLKPETISRLTIENDDKPGLFTTEELYQGICLNSPLPLVFDYHHYLCNPGSLSEKEALELALSTWAPKGIKSVVHYSEPRDPSNFRAHSDMLNIPLNHYGHDFDVMLEAKNKELALLDYEKKFLKNERPIHKSD